MKFQASNWGLSRKKQQESFYQKNDNKDDLSIDYARCFSTKEGQRVLNHLKSITLERSLSPDAKNETLRHLEGQRFLVTTIKNLITRGQNGG